MALTLISTPLNISTSDTAVSSVDITSGITSSYDSYEFHCINMYPQTNNVNFCFQVNADGASGFDEAVTSSSFRAYHKEDGSSGTLAYDANSDQATTDGNGVYQRIFSTGTGDDADQCVSGKLTLYAPSSPTYVKHFTAVGNGTDHGEFTVTSHTAGYINTTTAIDEISFKFDSGNIEAGTIRIYGVS